MNAQLHNEWMNKWIMNGRSNKRTKECMNEWTNDLMNEWTNKRMNEWMNERMNK